MEPKDLAKVWDAPDNTKLTPKQISLRLPIMVSAKISALCDMYPRKTKTEIIGDLLATSLDQFESGLESQKGQQIGVDPVNADGDLEAVFEDIGTRARFWRLTERYLRELEQEAGITEPMPVSSINIYEPIDREDSFNYHG
jgi:hypothetical protein